MKTEFPRQTFEKSSNIIFHENPSSGSRVLCGQTDRHDEANSPFSSLRTRPKMVYHCGQLGSSLITQYNYTETGRNGRLVTRLRGTTPSHLGRKPTGPFCTAFSSARHPQRRSTSSDTRALR